LGIEPVAELSAHGRVPLANPDAEWVLARLAAGEHRRDDVGCCRHGGECGGVRAAGIESR
jgi:hypothetical protein